MNIKKRIEEIEIEMDAILEQIKIMEEGEIDPNESFYDYIAKYEPYNKKLAKLSREKRMIMIPTFYELSEYGLVMSIKAFIESCEDRFFIDSDGFGKYVNDTHESDIIILPSDVEHHAIRKDFDKIIWFNK